MTPPILNLSAPVQCRPLYPLTGDSVATQPSRSEALGKRRQPSDRPITIHRGPECRVLIRPLQTDVRRPAEVHRCSLHTIVGLL